MKKRHGPGKGGASAARLARPARLQIRAVNADADDLFPLISVLQGRSETDVQRLLRLASVMFNSVISAPDRAMIERYLRLLAASPGALRELRTRRGHPRAQARAFDIVLDYVAQYGLLEKSAAAALSVAKAWSVSPGTVLDYCKKWKIPAKHELQRLARGNPTCERDELLREISRTLRSRIK
jgi:hypothetical protein